MLVISGKGFRSLSANRVVAIASLCLLLVGGCKHAPTTQPDERARAAITAMNKLNAKVQVGTTRSSYAEGLGDVQFAVNEYLGSDEPKDFPLLTPDLKSALDYYKTAGDLWSDQIKNAPDRNEPCFPLYGPKVPACSKFKSLITPRNGVDSIDFESSMQSLWALAGVIVSGLDVQREMGRDLETSK